MQERIAGELDGLGLLHKVGGMTVLVVVVVVLLLTRPACVAVPCCALFCMLLRGWAACPSQPHSTHLTHPAPLISPTNQPPQPAAPPPRELVLDDLKRVPLLSAALKESMRMLPVVSFMARVTERPCAVGSYKVPAGTIVCTPLFAIHNTVQNWDDPDRFRPERWADVPVETYVYNSKGAEGGGGGPGKRGITFMPFSEGPRNCVGQSLAKMEVMTLLAKLLGSFRVELAPEMGGRAGVRSRESTHLTLQTAGTKGIRCHLQPRGPHVGAAWAGAAGGGPEPPAATAAAAAPAGAVEG